jgi:hypothetical protein
MMDLYVATGIVLTFSAALAVAAFRLGRRRSSRRTAGLVVTCAVALLATDVAYFRHGLWPARVLPISSLIVLANPAPELTAIISGVALAIVPGRPARRCVLVVPLLGLALWASFGPVLFASPPDGLENRWRGAVCRQTSGASCAPAAAATLLRTCDIAATEAEMARLCPTGKEGTPARGLYRGLKLKTAASGWDVAPYTGGRDADSLRRATAEGPMILTVRLDGGAGVDPRFSRDWGWAPGVTHSVVLFGCKADGLFRVGDPAVGPEDWDRRAIDALWHGEAIVLRRRK